MISPSHQHLIDANKASDFPLEHPPLRSCLESVRLCPGFGEICGDELDPDDKELCKAHLKVEDRYYDLKGMEADGVEPMQWYPHLTDRD